MSIYHKAFNLFSFIVTSSLNLFLEPTSTKQWPLIGSKLQFTDFKSYKLPSGPQVQTHIVNSCTSLKSLDPTSHCIFAENKNGSSYLN